MLLAQRLLQQDFESALFRLNLSEEMGEVLRTLSLRDLTALSRCDSLLCELRPQDVTMVEKVIHDPRKHGLGAIHGSLILASRKPDQDD